MNLTAAEGEAAAQFHQLIPYHRAVLKDRKVAGEDRGGAGCLGRRFRLCP